jgi:Fic family protein
MIKAINKVRQDVIQEERDGITPDEIKAYNRQILEGLTLEEKVIPGEIRTYNVSVGRYWGPPAADCDYLLGRLCEWVNEIVAPARMEIVFGILKAIIAHLYLEWIHPFGDGNGRVGRLVEFKFLLEAGVPTPAAHLLSNHYNQTRNEYYRVLDQASKPGGDISSFISYAVKGYVDGLREQIETIRFQQLAVSWADYAQESLRKKKQGGTKDRQTQLVLDLARKNEPVPMDKIRELSPKVAESYAAKTRKTIVRDLNELMTAGLITFEPGVGYRVRIESIFAFLPAKRHRKERVPQGTGGSDGSGGT